ncbi:MAG TPA: hypothetical protein VKY33_07985 [Flavobacterium sp.]|nr:hypothetical protein [Flavobacterium sp.]
MNDLYKEYFGSSSIVLDTWFGNIKTMVWELLLLLMYVVLCWLIFKLLIKAASRFLRITKIEKLNDLYEKIDILKKVNVRIDFQKIIVTFLKFILLLIFVVVGADLFNFPGVTKLVNDVIAYLPRLVSAIAIILFGFYLANKIKLWLQKLLGIIGSSSGANIVTNIVVFGFIFFFVLMGLNQAGIDTTLITNNISIILGVIFASIALSFGLGSKDIVKEILYSYYLRKSVQVGDKIKIEADNVEGTIASIDNINVKILVQKGVVLYPIQKFVTLKIEIINE